MREEWADRVKKAVESWPPLTPEQRDRLAAILRPAPKPIRKSA